MSAVPRFRPPFARRLRALARAGALAVLALAALLARAEVQPPPTAPAVPGLRLPRDVVPVRYAPRLTIDPALPTFGGTIDIDVRVERPTDVVWLNAKGITLRDARAVVAGAPPDPIPAVRIGGSDDVMGLRFERPLPAGDVRIALAYTAPMDTVGAIGVFRQQEAGRWYALTMFEPMDARRAFPCFDEPDFKAEWRLTLVVPRAMRAFANMPAERESDAPDGMKEVAFARTPPLPSYLVAFAVGEFDVRDGGRAGRSATPITIVAPRGRGDEAAYAAAHSGAILAAAEHFFGQPYPFPKLDLIAFPRSSFGGAMENPGLITYTASLLLARPDEISPSFEQRFVGVTAHEIAHMWFGDYVTMAWWNDLWLNESFASWLSTRLVQELRPEWPPGTRRLRQRTYAIESDRLQNARRIRQPITDAGEVRAAFDAITYAKGETILAMFEQWLGPERFREGVRRYMAKYAWANATADDFFAALAATDDAIVPSFRDFVERAGVPLLTVTLDCAGAPRLLLAQTRFTPVGAPSAATAERWVFPACFEYGDATKGRQACVLVRDAQQSVSLEGACPRWVLANRYGTGYYLPRLAPPLFAALPNAAKVLADADYGPLLADTDLLARSGLVPYRDALSLAAQHSDSRNVEVAFRAYAVPRNLPPELVAPANQAKYAAWLRVHFGQRAHHLGWLPRKSDTQETPRLREAALPLVAVEGGDAALARESRRLAQRWLADRSAVPPQVRRIVLETAARTAGRGASVLFDGFVAVAKTTQDLNERDDVLNALGQFGDPVLGARALALALDPALHPRDGVQIVRAALDRAPTRPAALAWLGANFEQFGPRLPREQWSLLAFWAGDACTRAERERFVALLEPRLATVDAGASRYRQALENIDLCLALRDAQGGPLNAFLATQK